MAGPALILRELHRLQTHARNLRDEIDRGPRTVKIHEAKVVRQEDLLRESKEAVQKLRVEIREFESSLKTKHGQIEKHQKQLNESTSKKEYDALQAEITYDKKECQKLEEKILQAMEEVETRSARIPDVEKEVQRLNQEKARLIDDVQTRRNQLTNQLAEVHKSLAAAEAQLPIDAKEMYDRQTTARGDDALSRVDNRICAACYTEITAQSSNDLVQGKLVPCKSCGRILYLPESS